MNDSRSDSKTLDTTAENTREDDANVEEDEEQIVIVRRKKRAVVHEDIEDAQEHVSSKKSKNALEPRSFIVEETEEREDDRGNPLVIEKDVDGGHDDDGEDASQSETVKERDSDLNRSTKEEDDDEAKKSESDDEEYEKDEEELDEDDLALIEENLGLKITRRRDTHLRRFKKGERQESTRTDEEDSGQVLVRSTNHEKAREELRSKLFASEEEDQEKDLVGTKSQESSRKVLEDDFNSEEDDLSDFIVADEDEEQETEEPPEFGYDKKDKPRSRIQKETFGSSRQISTGALGDAIDIFGDGSEYAHVLPSENRLATEDVDESDSEEQLRPTVTLEEAFEPSILKEKYFTNLDENIRNTDIPERFQVRDRNRAPPEEGEIDQESLWMAHVIMKERKMQSSASAPPELIQAIVSVLKLMRHDYLEVPFIAHYRKELFYPHLTLDDLWCIYDADETWKSFYSRKVKLLDFYRLLQKQRVLQPDKEIEMAIHSAFTGDELTDHYDQLKLLSGMDSARIRSSDQKNVSKVLSVRDFYHTCKKAGLHSLATKIGIPAQQLGVNLSQNRKIYEAEDPSMPPAELAREYFNTIFSDVESVLRAVRLMLAEEISTEPMIRKFLRNFVRERSLITIRPTDKGKMEIDEFHKYTHIKYLSKKPFNSFEDAQFLELEQAEKEGFLQLNFDLDPDGDVFAELREFYCKEVYKSSFEEWDEQRALVLKEAWDRYLQPLLERHIRNSLSSRAIQFLKRLVHRTLSRKLMTGRFSPHSTSRATGREKSITSNFRIFTVSWVPGDPESVTFGVILNEHGDLVNYIRLTHMRTTHHAADERQRKLKEADLLTIREFLSTHLPKAVVICPGDMSCRRLFDDIKRVTDDLIRDRVLTSDIRVTFLDDEVAKIYQNSDSGLSEFPDYPPLLRYSISLGRRLIDPLSEYASLCNTKDDILSLKLHPLQNFLPSNVYAAMISRAFIDAVNAIGVDINLAISRPSYARMLQFVSGLGPRKAQFLIRTIRGIGRGFIERRQHLTSKYLLKSRVYTNTAPFLRVSSPFSGKSQQNLVMDVLDTTRIHPEDYGLARKMAADALEIEGSLEEDDNPSQYVEEVMKESTKLNDLLLEDYAKELEKRSGVRKQITLQDIRNELQTPFKDPRHVFELPTADEIFRLISSETDVSLHPGLILPVTVIRIQDRSVGCRLDSGLYGVIPLKEMTDGGIVYNHPRELFQENQVIYCRILAVHKDRFSVDLSARPSELDPMNRRWDIAMRKDRYYDWDLDRHEKHEDKLRQSHQKDFYVSRMIHHPLFKNMNFKMAHEYLGQKQPGDLVIRPSSKGPNHLTLSWKVADELIQHIDILEKDKTNEFTLGKSLYIDNERFEDLDEVVARYIEPVSFYVREISRHKNFRKDGACSRDQLADILNAEKSANPARIPYYLALSKELPGKAVLAYQSSRKACFETIDITPAGLKLTNQAFTNVDALVIWFKQHHQQISMTSVRHPPTHHPSYPSHPIPVYNRLPPSYSGPSMYPS